LDETRYPMTLEITFEILFARVALV